MLKISSFTGLSTILQSIDMANENKVENKKSGGNKTNLSNSFISTKSTRAGYLNFRGAKRDGGNTKGVKVTGGPNYPNPATIKVFNHLRHTFTQALIF